MPINLANKLLASLGLRVSRNVSPNRFQAIEQSLRLMTKRGFAPLDIIDAGANVGDWTKMARTVFPRARFHLIEPQSGCAPALSALARSTPEIRYHQIAVTRPGQRQVSMAGGGDSNRGTGAWILKDGDATPAQSVCDATTLDELFGNGVRQPLLMKLDLEGHELEALSGAESLLRQVEVVLTEVLFFDVYDRGRPLFSDVISFLAQREFDLYDIASLSGRPRDNRLRLGDALFVRRGSPLSTDRSWE